MQLPVRITRGRERLEYSVDDRWTRFQVDAKPLMAAQVMITTPDLRSIGGVETYYRSLDLPAQDPRIEYFFVTNADAESSLAMLRRLARNYWRFWRKLRTGAVRLVILNPSLNTNSFYRDAVFCRLARLSGVRVAVFFRGWSDDLERRVLEGGLAGATFNLSFRDVQDFIVLGRTFRQKLLQMGCDPSARFWLETTVADDADLCPSDLQRRLEGDGSLKLLFMSRLVASKGALLALQAYQIFRAAMPAIQATLRVAGDGPEMGTLRQFVADQRVPDVDFTGPVTGATKRKVLLDSDVLLFPTCHGEGMPNVILESMMYGLPVLSRSVGAIPDVIEHEQNGFLTSSTDPQLFADWITRLALDTPLRRRISFANHEKARRQFSTTAVRRRILHLIDEILTDNLRQAPGSSRP